MMKKIKNAKDLVSAVGVIDELGIIAHNNRTLGDTYEVIGVTFEVGAHFDPKGCEAFSQSWANERYDKVETKVKFELNEMMKLLYKDDTTREAYIIGVDYHPDNLPCNVVHHFIYRDNRLNLIVYLRSSDSVMKLVYDVYTNTRLLREVADKLKMEPNVVVFNVGSFHYYEDDEKTRQKDIKRHEPLHDWKDFVTFPRL